MLSLGSTDFNFSVPSVDAAQLENLSSSLFDDWESHVSNTLAIPDYSIFLQVDEGSIIGRGQIKTAAKTLILGISAYGGLMSGIGYLNAHMRSINTYLVESAQNIFECQTSKTTVRKSGGVPASLNRLFGRVRKGELTPEEATILAESIIESDGEKVPGLFQVLLNAFEGCPADPEQREFEFEDIPNKPQPLIEASTEKPSKPEKPIPRAPKAPSIHYRVEVWRESKSEKKKTKVSVL